MKGPTFDQERIHINVARLRKGGETFEIVVEPDAAVAWKESGSGDVDSVVNAQKVFSDAKKGMLASDEHIKSLFGTSDFETVAERILKEGDIQLTTEHRDRVREQKRRQLISRIHMNAVDPKTGNPHPEKRIELALAEAKVKMDEFRTVEQQLPDVIRKLQPVLAIRMENAQLRIVLPSNFAAKIYGEVKRQAKLLKERWRDDGSWEADVELPAGIKVDFIESINGMTHGGASIEERKVNR